VLISKIKEYLVLFGVAGVIVALDQWTKWLVRENIEFGGQWLPEWLAWLNPYARFVHWYNSGAAFGMFQNGNLVFTILAFVVIAAIIYYYPFVQHEDWTLKVAMGLQLAGAVGNLIDRLMMGKVTDFISVGAFPVFNIADASITVGVIVLLFGVWWKERNEKAASSQQSSVSSNQLSVSGDQSAAGGDQSSRVAE
jgi:signal peptidase II